MPTDAYIGLGSNIDPEQHLQAAVAALRERFRSVETSTVYRNPAVGFTGDDFLNMVARVRPGMSAGALERFLAEVERDAGRRRGATAPKAAGPRTLDLDLLLYGSLVDAELRLPRDDVLRYAFVLRPLAELAPDLAHPVTGRRLGSEWRAAAGRSPLMSVQPLRFP